MNLLTPPRKASRAPPQPAAALRVQSSLAGTPRSVGWGQARLAGNLIGDWGFTATAYAESGQGGKGAGSAPVAGYSYSAALAIGLSEGPIAAVLRAWTNKTPESLASLGFALFEGGYGQAPWGWLVANDAAYAQNFRGLAYVAAANFALGTSPTLPNLSFETRFAVAGAVTETATIPASAPYTVQAEYYDVVGNAAAEEIAVPYAAPYQYQATNPTGVPYTQTTITAGTLEPGGPYTGVYYTDTEPPQFLTEVSVSVAPSTGQYSVTEAGLYTFAAGDEGANVTIVDLAVSPGVNYAVPVTGTLAAGSALVASLSTVAGVAVGDPVLGAAVPAGAVVQQLSSGSATVTASAGSTIVMISGGVYTVTPGTPVTDSAGVIPAGTTVESLPGAVATLSAAATGTIDPPIAIAITCYGTWGTQAGTFLVADTSGIVVGATVNDQPNGPGILPYNQFFVASVAPGVSVFITDGTSDIADIIPPGVSEFLTFTTLIEGSLTAGSNLVTNITPAAPQIPNAPPVTDPTGALVAGAIASDVTGYIPGGTSVTGSSGTSMTLSAPASANATGDVLSFPQQMTLSQAALTSGAGVALTVVGAPLEQVIEAPSQGQFTLTPAGLYSFAASDAGQAILITDVPDANPADVVRDFLTNPYYGLPLFPAARLGDLSDYAAYCRAAGLWVSPVLSTQAAATQLLQELMAATNSAMVWGNGGKLTVVPYGDTALSANGASWTPPLQPLYSLDDDDFLPNEATNSASVSASDSPDPVTVTRLDPADQVNDVQIEYLDRAQDYNPVIAEAQDDAGINLRGLKPSGSKQLHLLCDRSAAVTAAQLQLGREQVRNLYSFTIDRKYILLDPMDIVAITDAGLGLRAQWVRVREITENDDRTLSIIAEEYLAGTGTAPRYGHQQGKGAAPNFNIAPGAALAPMFMDVPAQLVQTLGCEGWLATNGGRLWGGAQVWISSDNVNFHYAGTMNGGSTMGVLTASFASGGDPDTANTCSVDLTQSRGQLLPGTQADADAGNTACFVCNSDGTNGEYFSYEQATLTAQYKYDLGKHGANAGYLRRGLFGSTIAAHPAGSLFVRLRPGSVFTLPFDKSQIGNTIYVKLLSFNLYGGGTLDLGEATAYPHTIGGAAPALSSIGALALASDLSPGAATATYTGTGTPGGATTSGTGMAVSALGGVVGSVALQVSGFFGPGSGSPAASEITLSVQRIISGGTVTIYTGQPIALPASGNISFAFAVLDTPAPANGLVTYQVTGTSNQGIAPYGPTTVTILESRR